MTLNITQDSQLASLQILPFPPVKAGYATARMILRDPDSHNYDTVDAAFEVLIYSPEESDQILCENAVDWLKRVSIVPIVLLFAWAVSSFFVVAGLSFWLADTVQTWAIEDASKP